MIRRLYHQLCYLKSRDRKASIAAKVYMRLKYDCYISLRANIYYFKKIQLGKNVFINENTLLNFRSGYDNYEKNIVIGDNTRIMPYAKIIPQQVFVKIGENCGVQYSCLLYGVGGLVIGNDVRIAASTMIIPMNHIYSDPVVPIWKQGETANGTTIGNDVWIGSNSKILDGVVIGDGCVIGAGSVVTKDLSPYSVALGIPARIIKKRGA